MESLPVTMLQTAPLRWYADFGRHDLPWRNLNRLGVDAGYGVLVSEVMLQQTQVDRVIPKFNAFIRYFPTIKQLARAEQAKVVVLWSGLGYNRRAVNLHRAARRIVDDFGGQVPDDVTVLEKLPGIGPYTAAAISVFAYNAPIIAWDTNVRRFFELLFWGDAVPPLAEAKRTAQAYVAPNESGRWHSAVMDLMTRIRREKDGAKQQARLLVALDISPDWELPDLKGKRLTRPAQSPYVGSRRQARSAAIEFLRQQPNHAASLKQIEQFLLEQGFPFARQSSSLIKELKKDAIVRYREPLRAQTVVAL